MKYKSNEFETLQQQSRKIILEFPNNNGTLSFSFPYLSHRRSISLHARFVWRLAAVPNVIK